MHNPPDLAKSWLFAIARLLLILASLLPVFTLATDAQTYSEAPSRIYVVGHGWHTGLVVPMGSPLLEECPALWKFDGWPYVEIGWGDEGFYRGGTSIALDVALKAVATPTPTVLHAVGVATPVESFFKGSEVIAIDLSPDQFANLVRFVGAAFKMENGSPIDLGEGIYGDSQFFRAHGSYYFPNTCNVWTLKAIKAAQIPVFPPAGIRTENVISQVAKHGETLRRFPGRSRISVLVALVVGIALIARLRKLKRLALWAWAMLIVAIIDLAAVAMAEVNGVKIPSFLPSAAAWLCWTVVAAIGAAHVVAMRNRFRWIHSVGAGIATIVILIGLSPL